ncbi:MAG: ABC transporter permease [Candidatus Rokubacteria bacterium]|nr:ABC transporter permease [Candidatus Rokubacteria bacterium]
MTGARRVISTLIRRKPLGAVGGAIALGMVLVAIFADVLAPYDFNDTALLRALQRPGATHWFGTDELGRDVYSRVIHGARVSMLVGLAATAISIGLGGLIGIVSGYFGRRVDLVLQRLVDAWMAFPGLVMAIVILALLGPGLWSVILALGVSQAFSQSRTIRSATLVVREQPYIEASLAVGASHWRVLGRHVLPNVVAPIIIVASTFLGFVILVEAAVSFLGYGVPPPRPSWGGMLSATGRVYMIRAPWLSIFPGLALSLAVFGFNVLGDALRDLLDPRLRAS